MNTPRNSPTVQCIADPGLPQPPKKRKLTANQRAAHGARLEFIRTAGPRAIQKHLEDLVRKGEIVWNNDVEADARHLDFDPTLSRENLPDSGDYNWGADEDDCAVEWG